MRPATTTAALAALVLLPTSASSQAAPAPGPGAKIRITAPGLHLTREPGVLQDTASDTWTFRGDGWSGSRTLALSEITAVDVATTSHRHAGKGAAIGLGAGIVLGAFSGLLEGDDPLCPPPCRSWDCFLDEWCTSVEASTKAALGAVGGGALGAALGALLGLAARTYEWAPADIPASSRPVTFTPIVTADRTFGLSLRMPAR
ncbi:MAG: hypothetical protein FIA95_15380 [Gemmatimonadetes bacterium]|nr:hypothetical protein [Gemmatimonadota bacterium]